MTQSDEQPQVVVPVTCERHRYDFLARRMKIGPNDPRLVEEVTLQILLFRLAVEDPRVVARTKGSVRTPISDGHWLAGLMDGEGCFFLSTTRTRRARGYDRVYQCLTFEVKLAMRADDLNVVRQARAILGVGSIHIHRRSYSNSPNGKPLATLTVYARSDLPRVVSFFREFPLRSKKARDFQVWAEAFEFYKKALDSTPLTTVSKGVEHRLSLTGKRRPKAGTPRTRFRTIPLSVFAQLAMYERQIWALREYREPKQ